MRYHQVELQAELRKMYQGLLLEVGHMYQLALMGLHIQDREALVGLRNQDQDEPRRRWDELAAKVQLLAQWVLE